MTESQNNMTYSPVQNLLAALAEDESASQVSLEASLEARGLSPAKIKKSFNSIVAEGLRKQRLAWQEPAKANLAQMRWARARTVSWAQKSVQEVDEAFNRFVQGAFGSQGQLKVQAAFRNLDQVSTDDKVSFLDDVAALEDIEQDDPGNGA